MNVHIIDPDYQWKAAATQEGVDYGAVQKSFMDQSYGVVANKAKILFQDPFRLGFEIVHRNEKATRMVGIYAFRVNKNLLYVPTFFVNGEIKPADMLYRADVKRFVPLTEDWCAYLVRGVHESAGEPVDRDRMRQADAYMDRLAYPQRVKYASEEDFSEREACIEKLGDQVYVNYRLAGSAEELKSFSKGGLRKLARQDFDGMEEARDAFVKAARDGSLWRELMEHCADDTPLRKLLPLVINEHGPEVIEKVASMVDGSETAAKFLVTNYTREELTTADGWVSKEASDDGPQPAIEIILDPALAKSAAERETIFDRGFELVDKRPAETINLVVEEVSDGTIKDIASPGKLQVLLADGKMEEGVLVDCEDGFFRRRHHLDVMADCPVETGPAADRAVYFPGSNELLCLSYRQEVYGDEMIDQDLSVGALKASELQSGKHYVGLDTNRLCVSPVLRVNSVDKDGDCLIISTTTGWEEEQKIFYAPDRGRSNGDYISDETLFLEVKPDGDDKDRIKADCNKVLMTTEGLEKWFRTSGGVASSDDVTVRSNSDTTFDIEHSREGTILKRASNLGWLEAHLQLAEDFSITTDKAGEILDKATEGDVTYRVFDTRTKSAHLTRPQGMQQWIQSFDPELQVKLDAPQQQVLSTFTPERPKQQGRYGDVYQGDRGQPKESADSLIPMEAIMTQSPEELAQMSQAYDLPHIFDHGCVSQMATSQFNIVDQIKQYIPDLEAGVDRLFRILFLLRYRPGDFEEIYGKDDMVEFEQELSELASRSGENLLKMLQQFDPDQYSPQEN